MKLLYGTLAASTLGMISGCRGETLVSELSNPVLSLTMPLRATPAFAGSPEATATITSDVEEGDCPELDARATGVLYSVNMKQVSRGGDTDGTCASPMYSVAAGSVVRRENTVRTFGLFDAEGIVLEAFFPDLNGERKLATDGKLVAGAHGVVRLSPGSDVLANATLAFLGADGSEVFSVTGSDLAHDGNTLRFPIPAGAAPGAGKLRLDVRATPAITDCRGFTTCTVSSNDLSISVGASIEAP
ncbi:MAG: hypothetical protein HYV07_19490 [Deltaproteobacteria bacterium]|nr:hypothetical protein [Deltaproteobacteria bacterium]